MNYVFMFAFAIQSIFIIYRSQWILHNNSFQSATNTKFVVWLYDIIELCIVHMSLVFIIDVSTTSFCHHSQFLLTIRRWEFIDASLWVLNGIHFTCIGNGWRLKTEDWWLHLKGIVIVILIIRANNFQMKLLTIVCCYQQLLLTTIDRTLSHRSDARSSDSW